MAAEISSDATIIDNWYLSGYFIVIIIALIQFPFGLITKIEKLKFLSFIGATGIFTFITGMMVLFILRKYNGLISV